VSIFETEPCTRCGGSGSYSYCERFGTTCFKCRGNKVQFTPRGKAALEYLRALLTSKPASEFKVGETYKFGRDNPRTITRLMYGDKVNGVPQLTLVSGDYGLNVSFDTMLHVFPSNAELKVLQDKALKFQATLTKAGTPRKRA